MKIAKTWKEVHNAPFKKLPSNKKATYALFNGKQKVQIGDYPLLVHIRKVMIAEGRRADMMKIIKID